MSRRRKSTTPQKRKAGAPACRHRPLLQLHYDEVRGVDVQHRRCASCEAWLSMGPSNELPHRVLVEIFAARIEFSKLLGGPRGRVARRRGYDAYATDAGPPPYEGTAGRAVMMFGWEQGWLAAELRTHEHRDNIGRYAWDPARPLAEQQPAIQAWLARRAHDRAAEQGIELELAPLPAGSHDRIDCPCHHPPGEVGPCAGCNCADEIEVSEAQHDAERAFAAQVIAAAEPPVALIDAGDQPRPVDERIRVPPIDEVADEPEVLDLATDHSSSLETDSTGGDA